MNIIVLYLHPVAVDIAMHEQPQDSHNNQIMVEFRLKMLSYSHIKPWVVHCHPYKHNACMSLQRWHTNDYFIQNKDGFKSLSPFSLLYHFIISQFSTARSHSIEPARSFSLNIHLHVYFSLPAIISSAWLQLQQNKLRFSIIRYNHSTVLFSALEALLV